MNAKILTAVVGILLLVPAGMAVGYRFGDCPPSRDGYACYGEPNASGEPPALVTGHTVYAKFIIERDRIVIENINNKVTLGLPTDFAAIAGYFVLNDTAARSTHVDESVITQRECVVWFNGENLAQQPATDDFSAGDANAFPSDEDESANGTTAYDQSMQDYDFDRDVANCLPEEILRWNWTIEDPNSTYFFQEYAVAVEKGDCAPEDGSNFRYRGHLDFMDPNEIYHEVQEYDYSCLLDLPKESALCISEHGDLDCGPEFSVGVSAGVSEVVNQLFPWTYSDPHNEFGCSASNPPTAPSVTPASGNTFDTVNNSTVSTGSLDLGHKCNGTIQDLFKERLWMTQVHNPVYDAAIENYYTFALQVDTCAGLNPYDITGKQTDGEINNSSRYYELPQNGPAGNTLNVYPDHNAKSAMEIYNEIILENAYLLTDAVRDQFGAGVGNLGLEFVDLCTDGSSFSFDDTFRGRTVHSGAPATTEEIQRGNSFDSDAGSANYGKHREVCRDDRVQYPNNFYPNGSPNGTVKAKVANRDVTVPTGEVVNGGVPLEPDAPVSQVDCYPEDHKTAFVDLYVYDADPTGGLWAVNTKGLGTTGTPISYAQPAGYVSPRA